MKQFRSFTTLVAVSLFSLLASAQTAPHSQTKTWINTGPEGGDARSFASFPADPKSLYLGTSDGWIYHTSDGGETWKRLARMGDRDDLVIDNLIIDQSQR